MPTEEKKAVTADALVAGLAAKALQTPAAAQGKKFSEPIPDQAPKIDQVAMGKPEEKVAAGVGFDMVIDAIKENKTAARKIWDGNLILSRGDAGTGLVFSNPKTGTTLRAGLHNSDLLAEDWIIL